jgi:hypothetical protein
VHVHLFDSTAVLQQEALGVVGFNLIYGPSTVDESRRLSSAR